MKAAVPKKIKDQWMVRLDQGVKGAEDEKVVVTSANGEKQWCVLLDELYLSTEVGEYWRTIKLKEDEVPADAPKPTPPKFEAKWNGFPTKIIKTDAAGDVISETWGVGISMKDTKGQGPDGSDLSLAKGDIVNVETRSGKEWYAVLLGGKADERYNTWKCWTERV